MRALVVVALLCVNLCMVLADDCPTGLCPSDQTCCQGPVAGMYGCCPSPNAVCCSDGLHCCPTNTVCDLDKGTCDDKDPLIPHIFRKSQDPPKQKSVQVVESNKVEVVYCPGGVSYCPDGNTCCLLATGQYGCCPYPSAVCCNDRVHCCPYGTRCDATSQYCLQGEKKLFSALKGFAAPVQ